MDRRVVITGLGAVTPCGNSPEELWNSLMAGKHGFELAPWFPDQEPDNLSVVARVKDFDPSEYFDKKELRRNDVIVQYAVYCAMQALKDAGTDLKDIDPYRVGVVIGSGIGGIYTTEEEMSNYHNKGNKRVGVFTITKMIGNMAAGEVAIRTGFKGSNFCVTTACASGTQSIGEAFRSIKHGYLDAAIAATSDSATLRSTTCTLLHVPPMWTGRPFRSTRREADSCSATAADCWYSRSMSTQRLEELRSTQRFAATAAPATLTTKPARIPRARAARWR